MQHAEAISEEFITIIAGTSAEAMQQFKARGLDQQGFTIAHRMGTHRFALVDGAGPADLFEGRGMIAATFSRRISA